MDKISLNASMRNNLLSLQNISKSVSLTQNRLSTGLKVNSAIDNPSSYYTARSLNNRANDLSALLDSMGQAIQTIKAATTGLEAGAELLAQASAVATQALETCTIPAKSYFEEKVGPNGAVVTTAEELKQAIADNKETICVYGKISLENEEITLKDGQKFVGIDYFGNFSGKAFSVLNNGIIKSVGNNVEIADLTLIADSTDKPAITIMQGNSTNISNLDIFSQYITPTNVVQSAIYIAGENVVVYAKNINVHHLRQTLGQSTGITTSNGAQVVVDGYLNSFSDEGCYGGLYIGHGGTNNAKTTIASTAKLLLSAPKNVALLQNNSISDLANQPNRMIIQAGAHIAVKNGDEIKYYVLKSDYNSVVYEDADIIKFNNIINKMDVEEVAPWKIDAEENIINHKTPSDAQINSNQYSSILNQYDSLIKDSSYKGVNILRNDTLNVRFNEDSSSSLDVQGKDMTAAKIGVNAIGWQTQGDIAQSLRELAAAVKQIRSFQTELGNNYSIITNRQEFTESLINVLTEGADKLTLADMNEESANMLALQTRQQLAVNALSLASQASQGILKLF